MSYDTMYQTLQSRFGNWIVDYLTVDHDSEIWVRRGQILIVLQTLMIGSAWINFGYEFIRSMHFMLLSASPNAYYWLSSLFELLLMIVPLQLAHRGKVRLAAGFMLTLSVIGLVKYALARGFTSMDHLMMAVMMLLIPIAGVLLGASFSVIMAVFLCVLEFVLLRLFDPTMPSIVMISFFQINMALGLLMWGIFSTYDSAFDQRDREIKRQREEAHWAGQMSESLRVLQYQLSQYAEDEFRAPFDTVRQHLIQIGDAAVLESPESVNQHIDEILVILRQIERGWERQLAISPLGAIRTELHPTSYRVPLLLERVKQDFVELHDIHPDHIVLPADSDLPAVTGMPIIIREVLLKMLAYQHQHGAGMIRISADRLEDDQFRLRLRGEKPIRFRRTNSDQLTSETDVVELGRMRNWVEAMGGRLMIESQRGKVPHFAVHLPLCFRQPKNA